jgi:hypothetical protein
VSALQPGSQIDLSRLYIATPTTMYLRIDILIDCLMRNVFLGMIDAESSRDLLRRKPLRELAVDVLAYCLIFETVFSSAVTAMLERPFVCETRGVPLEKQGFVPSYFARNRGRASAEFLSNGPNRPFCSKPVLEFFALHNTEMPIIHILLMLQECCTYLLNLDNGSMALHHPAKQVRNLSVCVCFARRQASYGT